MKLKLYQVDAFTTKLFEGNPAAVIPLDKWLKDDVLQAIARENNLSESAFFVRQGEKYHLRWFTPVSEVDICGHATLASAFILFSDLGYNKDTICFSTRSGEINVTCYGDLYEMDFPALIPQVVDIPPAITNAFSVAPVECLAAEDYVVIFNNEDEILSINPDFNELEKLDKRGILITARAKADSEYDFVLRFFAPKHGIKEDPVTGSAFCQAAPYWAEKIGKHILQVKQCSDRGGEATCNVTGKRVYIAGKAVKYMDAVITIAE